MAFNAIHNWLWSQLAPDYEWARAREPQNR